MKSILILLFFTQLTFSQSREEFLNLSDKDKLLFIESSKVTDVYGQKEISMFISLNKEFDFKIQNLSIEISDLWGDTILEGPYILTDLVRSDIDSMFVYQGEVYALRISATAEAKNIDSCDYDEEQDDWIDCSEGIISESFYVDFNGNLIKNENFYPDFYN